MEDTARPRGVRGQAGLQRPQGLEMPEDEGLLTPEGEQLPPCTQYLARPGETKVDRAGPSPGGARSQRGGEKGGAHGCQGRHGAGWQGGHCAALSDGGQEEEATSAHSGGPEGSEA